MGDPLGRAAIDTCVIVAVLLKEPERVDASRWVLDQHRKAHTLVVPTLVLAELPGARGIRSKADTARQQRERKLRVGQALSWVRANQLQVVDIDEVVARDAAELAAEHGLAGADACVVAAAIAARCEQLYTWDNKLIDRCASLDFTVCEPVIPPGTQSEIPFEPQTVTKKRNSHQ